ncbi:hypothetical protein GlitD10_2344 [Gloeomargarita lithophora Alchichica-D10]|uniref:CHAT domain-containing protein n=1 Tax=Gloeomargarita lithophora Alchichica-D10 TaxID=1188229 RepID=A0A1J0AFF9_9CYAN|nr:CHAT domain-containing protein [Gloeomargarita lithophora]APB34678.1 hypothetical protein GlitD10_2344 [Gloeomargarita lithophora Alchichica-D10]
MYRKVALLLLVSLWLGQPLVLAQRRPNADNWQRADIPTLERLLSISRQQQRTGIEALILARLGELYQQQGQTAQAQAAYQQALALMTQSGNRLGETRLLSRMANAVTDPTTRIKLLERGMGLALNLPASERKALQNQLLSRLIQQGRSEQAYLWSDALRRQELQDFGEQIRAQIGTPAAQALLTQWRTLRQKWLQLQKNYDQDPSPALSQELLALQKELDSLKTQLTQQFPQLADWVQTSPRNLQKLQAQLPPQVAVLQPVLLSEASGGNVILFVVTAKSLTSTPVPVKPAELTTLIETYRNQLQNRRSQEFRTTSTQLYDLLIRPITAQLRQQNITHLSLIATDPFRTIPLETLYDQKEQKYLIQQYPVSYLTRISARNLAQNSPTGLKLLALGNPHPQDARALPGSEREVQAISELLTGSTRYLGKEATLVNFQRSAAGFPILHLATHGCFKDAGCPGLQMEPHTLLFADRNFQVADVAQLPLKNTDLVVLSACQTAVRTEESGGELAGVAYLFELAGARSVIASLWSVDDQVTSELMVEFYRQIYSGKPKAIALQNAKLTLINRHPYYWSPFILLGDSN